MCTQVWFASGVKTTAPKKGSGQLFRKAFLNAACLLRNLRMRAARASYSLHFRADRKEGRQARGSFLTLPPKYQ